MTPKERWLAVLWRETPEIFFNGFDRDEHHDLRRHPMRCTIRPITRIMRLSKRPLPEIMVVRLHHFAVNPYITVDLADYGSGELFERKT
jgi:hypothetical protein